MCQCLLVVSRRCRSSRLGTGAAALPAVPSLLLQPALAFSSATRRLAFNTPYKRKQGLEGDELIAEAVRLHGDIAARKKIVNVSRYWNLNYKLTRWLNEEHPAAQNALELHKRSAATCAGVYLKVDFKSLRWRSSEPLWRELDGWQQLEKLSRLIGCLAHSARATLLVLRQQPSPPFYIRADCLYHLRNARWEEIQADPGLHQWFWNQVRHLRMNGSWQERSMSERHFELILQSQTKTEQREMLSTYQKRFPEISDSTLLFFVDCYTRLGDVDKALSFLRRVSPELLQRKDSEVPPRYSAVRRCMNLLQLETIQQEGEAFSFRVLPAILELGVPPHDLMYSLVTANAIKLKAPNVAWDVHRHASGQGIRVIPAVNTMLLKDSYLRQDTNALNEALSAIQERPDLSSNSIIVAYTMYIVRSICFYQQQSGPAEIMERILAVYDKLYNRNHLAIAGIIREQDAELGNSERPNPDSLTLAFTVFFHIMVQRDQAIVNRAWTRLTMHIEEGNEVVLQAARHPLFYDGFIGYYSREKSAIPKALQILRYMLATKNCLPGDITWSRVISMLLRYKKDESAEKIWQIMLRRGVPVTEEGWRFIMQRYPYSNFALEVKKVLALRLEAKDKDDEQPAYARNGVDIAKTETSAVTVEQTDEDLDDLDAMLDVTAKQEDQLYSNPQESKLPSIWGNDKDFGAPLNLSQNKITEDPSTWDTQVKDTSSST